jgi:hypothetical protein
MSLNPYTDCITLLCHGFVNGLVRDPEKLYESTRLYEGLFVASWQNMRLPNIGANDTNTFRLPVHSFTTDFLRCMSLLPV